ncbi:DUF5110 domain-containing protein, partial [uncultured Xanthomonas sp.]|uniref:DUF5110 domain-containing protein n=1 Tax=uncultured Xanthomonas sp. TaxID=152831 RepID=UPI0025D3250C
GRFSLYEDDGTGYGYEQGEFSRIPLQWDQASGVLRIGAREGRWPGMQDRRTLHVRFVDGPRDDAGALEPAADASVEYRGQPLEVPRKSTGHAVAARAG